MTKEQAKPFSLRLSEEVRKKLEKLAKKNHRSLNAEIEVRLLTSIKNEEDYEKEDPLANIQALSGHLKQVAEALEIQAVLAQVDAGTLDIKE